VLSGQVNTAASKEGNLSKEDDGYLSDNGDTNLADDDGGQIESKGEGEGKGEEGESTNDDVLAEWLTWLPSAQGDESKPRCEDQDVRTKVIDVNRGQSGGFYLNTGMYSQQKKHDIAERGGCGV